MQRDVSDSKNTSGPKTLAGKKRVRYNALREGFFSKQLIVKDEDRLELEALRASLEKQFPTGTTMQQLAVDRIVSCTFRVRLALAREMRRQDGAIGAPASHDRSELAEPEVARWYGFGRAELRSAGRTLCSLRQEILSDNFNHPEEWREVLTKTFGEGFYALFANWSPQNSQATALAQMLLTQNKNFNMELPESLRTDSSAPVVLDTTTQREAMVKMIDLSLQQTNDIRRILDERSATAETQSSAAEDGRYFNSACRELERAVAWYIELIEMGL